MQLQKIIKPYLLIFSGLANCIEYKKSVIEIFSTI